MNEIAQPVSFAGMQRSVSPLSQDVIVGKDIIELLTGAMYADPLTIYREYIQNASDAIDMFQRVGAHLGNESALEISLSIQGKSLTIFDNGIGMDGEEMQKPPEQWHQLVLLL